MTGGGLLQVRVLTRKGNERKRSPHIFPLFALFGEQIDDEWDERIKLTCQVNVWGSNFQFSKWSPGHPCWLYQAYYY
ncbi:hypothetical protein IF1G_06021 [Cordyceps javanica]|uniref:Uncharacterized protein n=1 Tax=Cordyceps javanica TaxID=43265 RepID=A0A545UZY7_9HYPO|nr:hypothetical protein IF1G_06021 [Cordyceps javanica]